MIAITSWSTNRFICFSVIIKNVCKSILLGFGREFRKLRNIFGRVPSLLPNLESVGEEVSISNRRTRAVSEVGLGLCLDGVSCLLSRWRKEKKRNLHGTVFIPSTTQCLFHIPCGS